MREIAYRIVSIVLATVFVLCGLASGTLGWQSISQQARNDTQSKIIRQVELHKLQKQPDETESPVSGAAFYLFTADGTQLGAQYITDGEGKIHASLAAGDYYFEESAPAPGFTFDTDAQGARVTRYPFTITGVETEPVVVTAYNIRLQGALSLQKLVENADASPLTEAQKQQVFAFTVTFSDGGAYSYRMDGGEPQSIASGGTLHLKHGQTAVFEGLPVGISYTIAEQPVPGYEVTSIGSTGTITEAGSTARFVNTYAPSQTGDLTVSKEVFGKGADLGKAFTFTAVINGRSETFDLKHGAHKTFPDLPVGTTYTVTEADYTADGYIALTQSYTGVIQSADGVQLPFVNIYQPEAKPGSLRITKEVVGEHADRNKEFTFEVSFSDGKGYPYTINGGAPVATTGPNISLRLKGGQTARFEGIPEGVTYTVKESDPSGYRQDLSEAGGTVVGDSAYVLFRNHAPVEPEKPATLSITKKLAGEYPAADQNKAFHFTLLVDGGEQAFTLKPGETKTFTVPAGAPYEVREDNYSADGYALSLENGFGTAISGQAVKVTATNTFVGEVQVEIKGEKTWQLNGHNVALPDSITVQLKNGNLLVKEADVTPDENGKWQYAFTAPKYDTDGKATNYTVAEVPVESFIPSYNGFNILNTYLPPVEIDPPIIEKVVEGANAPETQFSFLLRGAEGAPMPAGSSGNTKTIHLTGSGAVEIGTFSFTAPGIYTYTVSELNTGADGWQYDTTIYTLTFTVTLENGVLHAKRELTKVGNPVDKALFINRYDEKLTEPDTVTIAGVKLWNHGNNPNVPDSIIVYIYTDGELAVQRLVTAKEDWRYSVTLPKYAQDGHEIVYTVGEADVPGYTAEIDGYNIINTYTGLTPNDPGSTPTNPGGGDEPGTTGDPQTGDYSNPGFGFAAMFLSLAVLILTRLLGKQEQNKAKRAKQR